MSYARREARVGEDALLIAEFRDSLGALYSPTSVDKVELLDTDEYTVLQEVTGAGILPLLQGTYGAVVDGANLSAAGLYFDRWTYHDANNVERTLTLELLVRVTVNDPLGAADLCLLTGSFVDLQGQPLTEGSVLVQQCYLPATRDGRAVLGDDLDIPIDANGMVAFSVVRGAHLTVSFGLSGSARDVIVPEAATADLLTLLGSAPDLYTVVQDDTQLLPSG